jgi:hypothetical protein
VGKKSADGVLKGGVEGAGQVMTAVSIAHLWFSFSA